MARTDQEHPRDRSFTSPAFYSGEALYVCDDCHQDAISIHMRYPEFTFRCLSCFTARYHDYPDSIKQAAQEHHP